MTESNSKSEFQWYATAFLDLLGQSRVLEKITELPNAENQVEVDAFIKQVKQSFGLVDQLNTSFEKHIAAAKSESSLAQNLPAEQRAKLKQLRSRPIKLQRFSDGVVVFSSVAERENESSLVALSALWGLLSGCASTFLIFLASKYPLRGGIDLGIGLEYRPNELYGPAVHRAYTLENSVANYPRIVVGNDLIQYLDSFKQNAPQKNASDEEKRLHIASQRIADRCRKLFVTDLDGRFILDYLGEDMRHSAIAAGLGHLAGQAFVYVTEQRKLALKNNDLKMAGRYLFLHHYFSVRLPQWPSENENPQVAKESASK
jgi:hypothetical protein